MGTHFTGTIAAMKPGDFWAHPGSLKLSPDDAELPFLNPNTIPQLPRERVERALHRAAEALDRAQVGKPIPFDPDEVFESEAEGKPS